MQYKRAEMVMKIVEEVQKSIYELGRRRKTFGDATRRISWRFRRRGIVNN